MRFLSCSQAAKLRASAVRGSKGHSKISAAPSGSCCARLSQCLATIPPPDSQFPSFLVQGSDHLQRRPAELPADHTIAASIVDIASTCSQRNTTQTAMIISTSAANDNRRRTALLLPLPPLPPPPASTFLPQHHYSTTTAAATATPGAVRLGFMRVRVIHSVRLSSWGLKPCRLAGRL